MINSLINSIQSYSIKNQIQSTIQTQIDRIQFNLIALKKKERNNFNRRNAKWQPTRTNRTKSQTSVNR